MVVLCTPGRTTTAKEGTVTGYTIAKLAAELWASVDDARDVVDELVMAEGRASRSTSTPPAASECTPATRSDNGG